MKVKVFKSGEIINIFENYMVVKDNRLFNLNTERYEAISGDAVYSEGKTYHVSKGQYTNFQIIPCEEAEHHCVVLSAKLAREKEIIIINYIKELEE